MASQDKDQSLDLSTGPRKRRWGRWVWGTLALLLALTLVVRCSGGGPRGPLYETAPILVGDLTILVTATGELEPTNQVTVGTEISGLITDVLVDFNDPVTAGQVLAVVDTEQLEASVTQREATLEQAEARVAQAEATVVEVRARRDRVAQLRQSRNASQQELEIANAELARAEATVRANRAEVRVAQALLALERSRLDKAQIRSPIDGVVLERLVEPGQTVAASFQTPNLFTIAGSLEAMELKVDIDEADIGRVAEGQRAIFDVDAYPGRSFEAEIVELRNAPRREQGVVTYEGILSVPNPDLALKPGMTATARITVDSASQVRLVPNGALRFVPQGQIATRLTALGDGSSRGAVWVLSADDTPRRIEVTLGRTDGSRTELLSEEPATGTEVIVNRALGR